MKKVVFMLVLLSSFLLAINLQIGEKKAEQIIEYRKINSIKSPEDLRNIKGFGDTIVNNVKNDVKVKGKLDKQTEKELKGSEKAMVISSSANKTESLRKEINKQDKRVKKDNENKK